MAARVADPAEHEAPGDAPQERRPVPGARVVLPLRPSRRRTGDEPSWERIVRRATLPAAAAITLFAVGGGITAALTGDPMSPLTGVTRAIDSFGGERTSYASLQQDLEQAQGALASGDVEKAKELVEAARSGLDDVPPAEADMLKQQIEEVQEQIAAAPTTPAPAPSTPPTQPSVSNPKPSSPQPSDTTEPSPSASEPSPTPGAERRALRDARSRRRRPPRHPRWPRRRPPRAARTGSDGWARPRPSRSVDARRASRASRAARRAPPGGQEHPSDALASKGFPLRPASRRGRRPRDRV